MKFIRTRKHKCPICKIEYKSFKEAHECHKKCIEKQKGERK